METIFKLVYFIVYDSGSQTGPQGPPALHVLGVLEQGNI